MQLRQFLCTKSVVFVQKDQTVPPDPFCRDHSDSLWHRAEQWSHQLWLLWRDRSSRKSICSFALFFCACRDSASCDTINGPTSTPQIPSTILTSWRRQGSLVWCNRMLICWWVTVSLHLVLAPIIYPLVDKQVLRKQGYHVAKLNGRLEVRRC